MLPKKISEKRPWGEYFIISDEENHKIKKIVIRPSKRISLQKHFKRSEHWYIVSGKAIVTLNNSKISLCKGESIDIPVKSVHRIENQEKSDLVFIEIQIGSYFGEDDIERIEDDFGRIVR